MKCFVLAMLVILFSCKNSLSVEHITIDTKSGDFFENIVSDVLLLLEHDLKKIIADDYSYVVNNSRFQLQANSWKPKPNPKTKLTSIFKQINKNNFKESFASAIQPVVEIACIPKSYDALNEYQSKCIKELFKYPIIQTINIGYDFKHGTSIDREITDLASVNDKFRYHQIVYSLADILNSAYERENKSRVSMSIDFVKHPIPIISASSNVIKSDISEAVIAAERKELDAKLDRIRIDCNTGQNGSHSCGDSWKKYYRHLLEELDSSPDSYFLSKPAREAREAQEAKEAKVARDKMLDWAINSSSARSRDDSDMINHGITDVRTGEFLAPAGNGYVSTRNGTFYTPAGSNGITNTRTGQFIPTF